MIGHEIDATERQRQLVMRVDQWRDYFIGLNPHFPSKRAGGSPLAALGRDAAGNAVRQPQYAIRPQRSDPMATEAGRYEYWLLWQPTHHRYDTVLRLLLPAWIEKYQPGMTDLQMDFLFASILPDALQEAEKKGQGTGPISVIQNIDRYVQRAFERYPDA